MHTLNLNILINLYRPWVASDDNSISDDRMIVRLHMTHELITQIRWPFYFHSNIDRETRYKRVWNKRRTKFLWIIGVSNAILAISTLWLSELSHSLFIFIIIFRFDQKNTVNSIFLRPISFMLSFFRSYVLFFTFSFSFIHIQRLLTNTIISISLNDINEKMMNHFKLIKCKVHDQR